MLRTLTLLSSTLTLALAATSTTASAYASNSDLSLALSPIAGPIKGSTSGSGTVWNLTIDDTSTGYKQNITGFGAAVTDATVVTIASLTSANQTALLQQLLNTSHSSTSAGFSMMRHTIGGSDLSPDPAYTYDDSSSPDPSLTNFSLGSRGTAMAALLLKMRNISPSLFILGSSWSAPGWMKESGNLDEPSRGCTTTSGATATPTPTVDPSNRLLDKFSNPSETNYTAAFAQYFVKYLEAFAKNESVTVNAIMIQNEPLNNVPCYPTMYMNGTEAGQLIENSIGPALAKAQLNTQIWGNDDDTKPSDITSAQAVLNIAGQFVKTIGWHCYDSSLNWQVLTDFHNNNTKNGVSVNQYMTECATPGATWYGAANFTIGPLQNWARGVMAWTLSAQLESDGTYGPHLSTGGCENCRGVVDVNANGTVRYNNAYYNIAQFSRFMPRGAIILSGTGSTTGELSPSPGVQSVASLNPDGTRSVVIMNTMTSALFVDLKTKSGETWGGTVPKQSVTTWVLPKAA